MREYASPETTRASDDSTVTNRLGGSPQRSVSEQAAEVVVRLGREADGASRAVQDVREAAAGNDPRRWREARDEATADIAHAEKSLSALRARQHDVAPELLPRLAAAEVSLAKARADLMTLTEAPRDWRPVPHEDELLAILTRPVAGSAGRAWEQKERDLRSAFAQLSPADSRTLADRIRKAHAGDPIVEAFGRMVPERRTRLVSFLEDARRREAVPPAPTGDREAPATSTAAPEGIPTATLEPAHKQKRTAFGDYIRINVVDIRNTIVGHLKSVPWPDPSADVAFLDGGEAAFVIEFSASFLPHLENAEELPQLLHPSDLLAEFQQLVPDGKHGSPSFAVAIAQATEASAKASLHRLAPRYHQALLRRRHRPDADDLTPSHPIDPLIANAMVAPNVLSEDFDQDAGAPPDDTAGVSKVDARWLGRRHPELWNFVQVVPASASVEDVAAALWGDPKKSTMAVALKKYGDVFRVAPAHARKVISERYQGELIGSADVDNETQVMALARSDLKQGDAATRELVQKGDAVDAPSPAQIAAIEHDIGVRLDAIREAAASVGMANDLTTAYGARAARLALLAGADAPTRTQWLPVLQFQHTQLISISPTIATLAKQLASFGEQATSERQQLAGTLLLYVRAAAVSHLRDESTTLLLTVAQRDHRNARRAADNTQREVLDATQEAAATPNGAVEGTGRAIEQVAEAREAVLDGPRAGHGPHEQEQALTLAGEVALRARMRSTDHSLNQLYAAATEAFGDPEKFHKIFPGIKVYPEMIGDVRSHLVDVQRVWDEATRAGTPQGPVEPNVPTDRLQWQGRAAGLAAARTRFWKIAGDQSIYAFVNEAREKIRDQQFRNAIASLATNLLITVATGMGAAALGKMAAAQLVGEAAGLAGKIAGLGIEVATTVTVNSAVQLALSDGQGSVGWTLLENTLVELFTRAVSGSIARVELAAASEARELAQLPHVGAAEQQALRSVNYAGAHLIADFVGGMASQWAARHLVQLAQRSGETISEPFALTALQQGAAIGLGRFFHGRVAGWKQHRAALERTKIGQLPEMRALFSERDAFHQTAAAAEANLSPEPALADQLIATEVHLIERETELIKSHPELMTSAGAAPHARPNEEHAHGGGNGPANGRQGEPARTRWGNVWPGEVPESAPAPQREIFKQAAEVYQGLARDGYQGASVGRVRWTEYLGEHGIAVEGKVRFGGAHEVYEHHEAQPQPTPAAVSLPRDTTAGERSANTEHVTAETCLSVADELIARGVELKGARREGNRIWLHSADGTPSIEIASPQPTRSDEMAALSHGSNGDVVWVSNTLTDEQVPRALGAILGEAIAYSGKVEHAGARFGELDAMLAHREQVASAPRSELPARPTLEEIRAHAHAEGRLESAARIDAELDLLMSRMGLLEPGPRRDHQLAQMSPELAQRVRARLDQRKGVQFQPAGMIDDASVAQPGEAPKTALGPSSVLPDAPTHVRAYNEGDRDAVLELRVELLVLREIDARTAQRDKPGTNNSPELAKGETSRREKHLARARELMAKLQLGGDTPYIKARLHELEAVFPGIENDLVPMMEMRAARRDTVATKHQEMNEFRTERAARQRDITRDLLGESVIKTKRLVVGDGFSGLADIASLGVQKQGEWIPPSELLVFGGADLIAQLAARDPSFRWGQRAATYDRATGAHPAFSDAEGRGTGELAENVEDPGEFMHVGELRDGMDRARQRLGIAAVDATVLKVEMASDSIPDPPWEVDAQQFPVRVRAVIANQPRFVYVDHADLATGPGKPRMPNETVLSPADREKLLGKANGEGVMFSGDKMLAQHRDLNGKRVLVMTFGPTGAWAAVVAAQSGAARVDFTGGVGGEADTAMYKRVLADWKKQQPRAGEEPKRPQGDVPSNQSTYNDLGQIDRVQDALHGDDKLHLTMDRIVHIEPAGEGAVVTYAHGPGEDAEVYQVTYDVVVSNMGYTTNADAPAIPGEPTVKEMIGKRKMVPQKGSSAPVLQDESGHIRVMGFAAGDAVNVSGERDARGRSDRGELAARRNQTTAQTSADSPDDRVVEGVGIASRMSNQNAGQTP